MKLELLEIDNFRGIEHLRLDCRDELGLIPDRLPIVGPNASGKTAILDAISLTLMPITELVGLREGLALSPVSLVRRDALEAHATCHLRFSADEIAATNELFALIGRPTHVTESCREVRVNWQFPDPQDKYRTGRSICEPHESWALFKARVNAVRSLRVPGVSSLLARLPGVCLFDQQRTGLAQRISRRELELLGISSEVEGNGSAGEGEGSEPGRVLVKEPRVLLLRLAMRAQARQAPGATSAKDFKRLQDLFAQICQPHHLCGTIDTDTGLDLEFEGPQGIYRYDGLSSGQQMILLLLLAFATRRIHHSIVLIDELELHLHPLWQDRLYYSLPQLGSDNQFLFTTHSTYLRDSIRDDFMHCTGDLGEEAYVKKSAAE
jgi:hypothetical protein